MPAPDPRPSFPPREVRLTLVGIGKRFGPLRALDDVHLDLRGGEIHALLGENGAGKSTLMNVLFGLLRPDAGRIEMNGVAVSLRAPRDAQRLGIGMVHQHFTVVDRLTTAENLALSLPRVGVRFRQREVAAAALALAARVGLDIGDPLALAGTLAVGTRQRIEILKALAGDARILIFDEPTAMLTPQEVAQLFAVLRRLRDEGCAVVFISHKLAEVRAVADRVTVLRRGKVVGSGRPASLSDADLAVMMVGAVLPSARRPPAPRGAALLDVDGVSLRPGAAGVTLRLCAGEVFGVVGVDGNGQAELFQVLAGLRSAGAGAIAVRGAPVKRATPASMLAAGVGLIPPDRRDEGLAAQMSVAENLILNRVILDRLSSRRVLQAAAVDAFVRDAMRHYNIRDDAREVPVATLSGGNQQRVVVARALGADPDVLIAVNPTRGLDIGAARGVHEALNACATAGKGVILISTDLDEVLEMSDRVAVLFRHELSAPLEPPFAADRIGLLMGGSAAAA